MSSDFNSSTHATQLQIANNSIGHFIVSSSTADSSINLTVSNTLNILQTVIASNPFYGSTLSQSKAKNNNSFSFMISKDILEQYEDISIGASFITFNTSSYQWTEVANAQIIGLSADQTSKGSYLIFNDIKGIGINQSTLESAFGGPYFLLFGLKNTTTDKWTNYYSINRNLDNMNDARYQYLVYNDSALVLSLSKSIFGMYEDISMNVSVGSELREIELFTTFEPVNGSNTNLIFSADCGAHKYDYFFDSFGWKFGVFDVVNGGDINVNNIESGISYNSSIYWAVTQNQSDFFGDEQLRKSYLLLSSVETMKNIKITKEIFDAVTYSNFTFYAASNQTITMETSYNFGTNVSLQIEQCVNNKCNYFGNATFVIVNDTKEQKIKISFPDSLQSEELTNGLNTYLIATTDLCQSAGNVSTKTKIKILPKFDKYVIGDALPNISWNKTMFANDKTLQLRLLYWNSGNFEDTNYGILPFGTIINNGSLIAFQPNFTQNAQHILINDFGAIGIVNLLGKTKNYNLSSRAYDLFQPISMNKPIKAHVIAKDDEYNAHYVVNGQLISSLVHSGPVAQLKFNAYLTNITDAKSMNISTKKQYSLTNISSIIDSKNCIVKSTKHKGVNATFCPFELSFYDALNDTNDVIDDGVYIIAISRYNEVSDVSMFDTNYFWINNGQNYANKSYQFLVYTQKDLKVSIDGINDGNVSIKSYESKTMGITAGGFKGMLYATMESEQNVYVFDCGSARYVQQFRSFGWKFCNLNASKSQNIESGMYRVKLYWNMIDDDFELITNGKVTIDLTMYDANDADFVPMIKAEDLSKNKYYEFHKGTSANFAFSSSIQPYSDISLYFEQCRTNSTGDKGECIKFYPNNDGKPLVFEWFQNGQVQAINVPQNDSLKENVVFTNLMMDVKLCDDENIITTRQYITIEKALSDDSDGLSVGAIVGLVVSVLIICALTAWWLYMKNSSGDGYRVMTE